MRDRVSPRVWHAARTRRLRGALLGPTPKENITQKIWPRSEVVFSFGAMGCKVIKDQATTRKINAATARLAQSVERKALNLVVVGSSPTVGGFQRKMKKCFCSTSLLPAVLSGGRGHHCLNPAALEAKRSGERSPKALLSCAGAGPGTARKETRAMPRNSSTSNREKRGIVSAAA